MWQNFDKRRNVCLIDTFDDGYQNYYKYENLSYIIVTNSRGKSIKKYKKSEIIINSISSWKVRS